MGELAEQIEGRIAGAIKQHDEHDVLGESVVDDVAADLASQYEQRIESRMSVETYALLVGDREPPGDSDGDE